MKYKKSTIDRAIYHKLFSDETISYLTFYTDNVLNNTNNEIAFPGPRKVFEEVLRLNSKTGMSLNA